MVESEESKTISIGFIGMGSRGLSTLERVLSYAENLEANIKIVIFEPKHLGCGVHNPNLEDYLLLNTVASQLGIFPDEVNLLEFDNVKPREGLDFYEWCLFNDIRIDRRGRVVKDGKKVEKMDFLPRRLLGEYLNNAYEEIISNTPESVSITVFKEKALGIKLNTWEENSDYRTYKIKGEDNNVDVDKLILTVGHGLTQINTSLDSISHAQSVLISGMGLTAMDQIAELTLGRDGEFVYENEKCTYIPSNKEPEIFMKSRGGLTYWSRPNTPEDRERHIPVIFTKERIDKIRSEKGRELDFDLDILPLMVVEMRCAALAVNLSDGSQKDVHRNNLNMVEIGQSLDTGIENIKSYLEVKEKAFEKLDLEKLIKREIPNNLAQDEYQEWVLSSLKDDLYQSSIGITHSPIKAAAETWRDLRENLRYVANNRGLNESSHRRFYEFWVGAINRLVAGPQKERIEDLIALIEAGVLTILHPNATLDVNLLKIDARVNRIGVNSQQEGIIFDLKELGKIRPVINESGYDGLEVDESNNPIGINGNVTQNIWVLGPIVEGATYYNHYIPTTGCSNRAISEAQKVALQLLSI